MTPVHPAQTAHDSRRAERTKTACSVAKTFDPVNRTGYKETTLRDQSPDNRSGSDVADVRLAGDATSRHVSGIRADYSSCTPCVRWACMASNAHGGMR